MGLVVVTADEITRVLVGAAETSLNQARRSWLGERPRVRSVTAVGDAATRVIEIAEREQADLIVIASHGYGPIRR
jgi:nucleotide-binding universal stress UspA family protein